MQGDISRCARLRRQSRTLLARGAARRGYAWGLAAVALLYWFMAVALALRLTQHSAHDSYTLQAMVWRSGHIALPENYDWLELAFYKGRYYVSFPPFPTVPMWVLTFLFGANTPSMLVNFLMLLGSYTVGYAIARERGQSDGMAAAFAAFWVVGCNLLEVSLYGGVWNMAQGMAFLLTMLAAYGTLKPRGAWGMAGPLCLACAVGCRPFQAVYVPVVLWALWQGRRVPGEPLCATLRRVCPALIAPALMACAYAAYNWVRFDNPLEFGHNYLPEFIEAEQGQFSLAYVGQNIANILRLPAFENGRLRFPAAYGFAFYLCNPLFLLAAARVLETLARKRRLEAFEGLLLACAGVHFFLLLLHKSFGAWQFGTRYLIDLLPMLGLLALYAKKPIRVWEGFVMLWGVAFNVYGGLLFHLL